MPDRVFVDRVHELSREDSEVFEDLKLFLVYYSAYLSASQKGFLRDLGVEAPPIDIPMRGLLGQHSPRPHPPSWENILFEQRLQASPLQHLEQWAKLMPRIGILGTYVLVDGVDEIMESAENPIYAHSSIRPILTHLRLMDETDHLALKFFLPSDVEPLVLSDPAFRKDRGFVIQKIQWKDDD